MKSRNKKLNARKRKRVPSESSPRLQKDKNMYVPVQRKHSGLFHTLYRRLLKEGKGVHYTASKNLPARLKLACMRLRREEYKIEKVLLSLY
jgi:hypothetical protein